MAERSRDAWRKCVESTILRGGSLRGKILGQRVKFRANIYGPLDGRMVILQL